MIESLNDLERISKQLLFSSLNNLNISCEDKQTLLLHCRKKSLLLKCLIEIRAWCMIIWPYMIYRFFCRANAIRNLNEEDS